MLRTVTRFGFFWVVHLGPRWRRLSIVALLLVDVALTVESESVCQRADERRNPFLDFVNRWTLPVSGPFPRQRGTWPSWNSCHVSRRFLFVCASQSPCPSPFEAHRALTSLPKVRTFAPVSFCGCVRRFLSVFFFQDDDLSSSVLLVS